MAVAVTPDGRLVISAADDGTLRVWDLATGAEAWLLSDRAGLVRGLAVTSDGQLLLSGSAEMTVQVWDLASGVAAAPPGTA